MVERTLRVRGMSCDHCVRAVTKALEAVPSVRRVVVDLAGGKVVVGYDEEAPPPDASLRAAIVEAGYEVDG